MAIYFIIIYLIMNVGLVCGLPIKNNFVKVELTDEQIVIAKNALRNDIRYSGTISAEVSRNAIPYDWWRWPSGVIYYTVDRGLDKYKDLIHYSLAEMMKEIGVRSDNSSACVSFIPRTDQPNYVTYFNGSDGCWSFVGRKADTLQQPISIGEGCQYQGTIIHETMHALGFWHEHQRSDRDDHVVIHFENVEPDHFSQFEIKSNDSLLAPFDYESIMIYGNKAFSKNKLDTIVAINGQRLRYPYDKLALTGHNIHAIRSLYGCEDPVVIPTPTTTQITTTSPITTPITTSITTPITTPSTTLPLTETTPSTLLKPTKPSSSTSLKIILVNTATLTLIFMHTFYRLYFTF